MTFTYYGHSCFAIEISGKQLLFDPFISGNELAAHIDVHEVPADYIFVSHGHTDHILDCEAIALRTGALVICNWEIHEYLQGRGVSNTHPMNTGGSKEFPEFRIKCTVAHHSSSLPDGSYAGNPMGCIIYAGAQSYYYSGDTALTLDMQLVATWAQLSAAILPIGDNFTMGVEDMILAAGFINCTKIVGVHYDTFGFIRINKETVLERCTQAGISLLLPGIGESIDL